MRIFLLITIAFFFSDLRAQSENYLYKAKFIRAAPGKLLDLIDLYKERMSIYDTAGVERPFWMRHSQGDQWDLMILFPIGSYENYYSSTKIQKRKRAFSEHPEFDRKHREYVAWQEEVYVFGAPLEAVREMFANTSFYHVEIFRALPGKHDEPYQQRQMENVYLKKTLPSAKSHFRSRSRRWLGCVYHWLLSRFKTFCRERRHSRSRRR